MKRITITLSDAQFAKLEELAAARTAQTRGKVQFTPERCIRGFVDACQPGGSGWLHPSTPRKEDA